MKRENLNFSMIILLIVRMIFISHTKNSGGGEEAVVPEGRNKLLCLYISFQNSFYNSSSIKFVKVIVSETKKYTLCYL